MNRKTLLLVLPIIGLVLLCFYTLLSTEKSQQQTLLEKYGFYRFDQPKILTDVTLTNMQGQSAGILSLTHGWRLVNFGYLFCPDICPINLALLRDVKQVWDQVPQAPPLSVIHITFDPKRDQPEILRPYLRQMHPAFYGFTGRMEAISDFARQLNVIFFPSKADAKGHYFITHTDSIALINPKNEYVGMFKGPYQQEKVLAFLAYWLGGDIDLSTDHSAG